MVGMYLDESCRQHFGKNLEKTSLLFFIFLMASKRKYEYVSSTAFPAPGKISRRKFQQYKSRPVRKLQSVARTRGALVRNPERKYFDSGLLGGVFVAATSWAGCELDPTTLNTLFLPIVGSDINNRIGRKVSVFKISVRGAIHVAPQTAQTAADAPCVVRLIMYQDMQTNAAQVQAETLMSSPTPADAQLTPHTHQNLAGFGRFRVLKDKIFHITNVPITWNGTNLTQTGTIIPFKFTVKFAKPVEVHFNSADGGSVADIVDHSFHMIGCVSNAAYVPDIDYQCRTVYTDV